MLTIQSPAPEKLGNNYNKSKFWAWLSAGGINLHTPGLIQSKPPETAAGKGERAKESGLQESGLDSIK